MKPTLYVTLISRFRRRYVTEINLATHRQPQVRDPRLRFALAGMGDGLDGSEPTPRPFPDPALEEPYEIGHMIGAHLRTMAMQRLGFPPHTGGKGPH